MNIRQINKFRSYVGVESACKRYKPVWNAAAVPEFGLAVTDLSERIVIIRGLGQRQEDPTTGIAAMKLHCRKQVCTTGAIIAGAVHSWATKTNQLDIAQKADWSYSDLFAGRETASADRCQNVHKLAKENLSSLAKFGVTADKLEEFQEQVDAYLGCIGKPREAITTTRTVTQQLATEFAAVDKLLEKTLDKLVLQFQESAPDFFNDYQNARFIVDQNGARETDEASADTAKPAASAQPAQPAQSQPTQSAQSAQSPQPETPAQPEQPVAQPEQPSAQSQPKAA